ncbi:putative F-box protein [Raphanus sativus]|nr:putative F-box protein [Raphanus sativus]
MEILSRLPPKSIMRHRCVSKLWSSITRLPSFINLFTSRSSARLLLTFEFYKKQLVFSFPQNQNTDGSYSPVYSHHMTGMHYYDDPHSESVQGLILLRCLQIWNPSLCQVLTLPHHKENNSSSRYMFKPYLGYDPLEGKHKVLYLFYGKYVELQILTLGANESWRRITKGIPMHSPTVGGLRKCFNGVLYYEATAYGQHIIMSFDVKSESFRAIKYPKKYSQSRLPFNMIPYEGRLALVTDDNFRHRDVEFFILKDANGYEWTRRHWPCVPCKSEWRNHMQFKGITDAGELIFAPRNFVDSFYILYFDPRGNSTREAFFKGFVGGDFGHIHGVKYRTQCKNVFPNHMENLVSL